MNYLIVDIGNTNIVMAVFDGKKIKKKWRISSFLNRTKDEYILWLKYIADQNFTFKDIIIGSVVPDITQELKVALRKGNSNFASFSQPIPHHANGLSSSSVATWTSPQHDASMMDEARSTLTDAMMNHFKRSDEMKKTEVDDEDEQRYSPTRMEEQAELESLRET